MREGTRPSELKLAAVFEVLEAVMEKFGRFAPLMEVVREVLCRAVYVDPPKRPPLEDRIVARPTAGQPRMSGVRTSSMGATDALTSYVAVSGVAARVVVWHVVA